MRAYVAGPMRGYPEFNFPAFDEIAQRFRAEGWEIVNPADHDREQYPDLTSWPGYASGDTTQCPAFSLKEALLWDLTQIADCDYIILLPGWQGSSGGVKVELALANALGLKVLEVQLAVPR